MTWRRKNNNSHMKIMDMKMDKDIESWFGIYSIK